MVELVVVVDSVSRHRGVELMLVIVDVYKSY